MPDHHDVIVLGAGHNGLVAATVLGRAGLDVCVVERADVAGGAVRTEHPFARAPGLGQSTGAYLLGLMPPELIARLGLRLPLRRRDPHYFLPTTGARYLLLGSDEAAARQQLEAFFSPRDVAAIAAMDAELAALRDDIGPTWLMAPLSLEDTAARYVRPALREIFVDLCRGSVLDYLARFDFQDPLLVAMFAVTDGISGSSGGLDTPGTGLNFLVHNMCRLPGSGGTWMVVEGGMGTVTRQLLGAAREAGALLLTASPVVAIERGAEGAVSGVRLEDGRTLSASVVISNADPYTTRDLVGRATYDDALNDRLDAQRRDGMTMKVNLALSGLPTFTCLPEAVGQHRGTIHLLPDTADVLGAIRSAHADALAGRLPDFPTLEWYIQTPVDPTLTDADGRQSAALFVQWVPHEVAGSSWEAEADRYALHLLSLCDRFAPGTSALVDDMLVLHPKAIESRFGMRHGHIHHLDNIFGFDARVPYRLPVPGLYACGAGCHPGGAVIGAPGHNAAMRVLADLGVKV